jgi:hypothetical protein
VWQWPSTKAPVRHIKRDRVLYTVLGLRKPKARTPVSWRRDNFGFSTIKTLLRFQQEEVLMKRKYVHRDKYVRELVTLVQTWPDRNARVELLNVCAEAAYVDFPDGRIVFLDGQPHDLWAIWYGWWDRFDPGAARI